MVQPTLGTALFLPLEKLRMTGRQTIFYEKAKLVIYYHYHCYYFKPSQNQCALLPGLCQNGNNLENRGPPTNEKAVQVARVPMARGRIYQGDKQQWVTQGTTTTCESEVRCRMGSAA